MPLPDGNPPSRRPRLTRWGHGYTVWRQNTAGIYDAAKARWHVTRQEDAANPQGRSEVPDIIGFRKRGGVFIGVEGPAVRRHLLRRPPALHLLRSLTAGALRVAPPPGAHHRAPQVEAHE